MANAHRTDEPLPSERLADYIHTDTNGYKSFNYAGQTGSLLAVLDHLRETLHATKHMSAKDRNEAMKDIRKYADTWHERMNQLQREWTDFYPRHIEWRKQKNLAAIDRLRGGPTVEDPDRPYCKPDQSCCDFACGN